MRVLNFLLRNHIKVLLFLIIILGAFLRFYKSYDYFPLERDQLHDVLFLEDLWKKVEDKKILPLPLHSDDGTLVALENDGSLVKYITYHGVLSYYFLLPAAVISNFHPYGLVIFLMSLSTLSIYLMFILGREFFDEYVGLFAAFLFAILHPVVLYSRWIWFPSLVPFFVLLSLIAFFKIHSGDKRYWYLFSFATAGVSQIHNSGYFFLLFMIVMAFVYRLKLPETKVSKFLNLFIFVLILAPLSIWDIQTNFYRFRIVFRVINLAIGREEGNGFLEILSNFVRFIRTIFNYGDLEEGFFERLVPPFLFLGLLGFFWLKRIKFSYPTKEKRNIFIFCWLVAFSFLPFLVAKFYGPELNRTNWMNNLLLGMPLTLLFFSALLRLILKNIFWVPMAFVIFFYIIYLNSISVRNDLWGEASDFKFKDKIRVVHIIANDAGGEPFSLEYPVRDKWADDSLVSIFLMEGLPPPERFNGANFWGYPQRLRFLRNARVSREYFIADPRFQQDLNRENLGQYIGGSGPFGVYVSKLP